MHTQQNQGVFESSLGMQILQASFFLEQICSKDHISKNDFATCVYIEYQYMYKIYCYVSKFHAIHLSRNLSGFIYSIFFTSGMTTLWKSFPQTL